ncbi:LysR family transcriptional regulator [Ensifer sp. MPMI2T]|nr:LysR family transcriptional regulator [Ensifer sp. MPMI2T]
MAHRFERSNGWRSTEGYLDDGIGTRTPDHLYDLRYFKYAIAAAELGSFRRAAEALGVQQSEVSRRIQALEDRLGIDLFVRHRTGSRPTAAGRLFLREAERGLRLLSDAAARTSSVRRAERGELHVGIIASLSAGSLRNLLFRYADRYPGVRITLHRGTHDDHYARLLNGTADIAFVTGKPNHPAISSQSLWTEEKLVAMPRNHALSASDMVSWSQLKRQRFLVSADGPGPEIQRHIIKHLAGPGFNPDIAIHELGTEDLLHLVSIGFGVMITSEAIVGARETDIVVRRLSDDEPLLWNAVWLTSNRNPNLHKILALARSRDFALTRGRSDHTSYRR